MCVNEDDCLLVVILSVPPICTLLLLSVGVLAVAGSVTDMVAFASVLYGNHPAL